MNAALIFNSLVVAGGAGVIALLAGWAVALAVATSGEWGRRLGWVGAGATLALPSFIPANAWLEWTAAWRTAVGPERSAPGMFGLTALVLGLALWPVTFFLVLGAWERVRIELVEAEPTLRGGAVLRWVLLPAARSALTLSAVVTLALAMANFTVPVLFQVRVFTEEFWIRYNTQFDLRGALGSTWWLWLLPLTVGIWTGRDDVSWPRGSGGVSPGLLRARLGVWSPLAWGGAWLVIGVALLLPIGGLVFNSRTWMELPSAIAAAQVATANSLWAAAGTSVLVSLVALVVARNWGARGGFFTATRWLAWSLFLLPGVFLGGLLIESLNRPGLVGFYASFGIILLALALRYFALAAGGLAAAMRAGDRSLSEAAMLSGAGPGSWSYFQLVTWPQAGRTILAVAYAVYLLCLWDVETIVLLQPPGGETLALRIFNLLHYGHAGQVNALCLVVLGLAGLPALLFVSWNRLSALGKGMGKRKGKGRGLSVSLGAVAALGLAGCGASAEVPHGQRHPLASQTFSAVEVRGSRGVAPGQFNKPRSLVCDREDNLYVTDMTGRVQKFSADGGFLLQWQMPQTELGKPKGMTIDPVGNVVVIEPHYQRVNHFTTAGKLVAQWGHRGTKVGEFILPRCVGVNSAGEYYFGEYTSVERLQRFGLTFDLANTSTSPPLTNAPFILLGSWGQPGQENGDLDRAEGLAIGPGDQVYVADSCNHRIQVFDRSGRWLRSHGVAGATAGRLSYPYDIRVEGDGRQFVCEFGNSRLSIFDAHDQLIEVIGHAGAAPGEFANPWAICLDSRGNVYVADSQNHRVQKLIRRNPLVAGTRP